MATIIFTAPQVSEVKPLLDEFRRRSYSSRQIQVGIMNCFEIPPLDIVVSIGGHGKTRFAIQTNT
jgi:hypothetical protein